MIHSFIAYVLNTGFYNNVQAPSSGDTIHLVVIGHKSVCECYQVIISTLSTWQSLVHINLKTSSTFVNILTTTICRTIHLVIIGH